MYKMLKQVRPGVVAALQQERRETHAALDTIRIPMVAMHQDMQNIRAMLTRHETRLDHIERGLEVAEVPR